MAYRSPQSGEPLGGGKTVEMGEVQALNKPDTHIWGVYGCLIVISIIELYSASSFEIAHGGLYSPLIRHVSMLLAGFLIILGLQRIHYSYFVKPGIIVAGLSVLAMAYVMFFGESINGAKRAITLPFMTLQPSEFIKLSAVLVLSYILGTTQLKKDEHIRNRGLGWAAGIVIVFSGLLITQGLTNTLILMAICVSMLIVGSLEIRKFWIIMAIFAGFGAVAVGAKVVMTKLESAKVKEQKEVVDMNGVVYYLPDINEGGNRMTDGTWGGRFTAFLDTTPRYKRDLTPANIQETRSYMAQANGGVIGVFPGNSRETARLPLAFSDFIYAIIVEELGFVGGMVVMLLYIWLLARAYFIAYKCKQMYPAFLVTGCALLITLQALCHMAIVSGAGPVSGQPLPLISKGGTSILVTSIAFGIMLSVSRFAARSGSTSAERESDKNALPTELQAANPSQV
ncbi:MAG: FtsW/RodA/SpoVE family cell cycle protein [Bacteroides sp.]|nr:FtsW/RodA/SpoVE family cell cycle protein [Bacteroides sp.]MCM1379212.1 FtsW/RodA/SpoVE family cell cycle protein [Bacteroides sp.]MCM1445139.1 FtsW/RodA/SpoVE family cell cycle protein [Prevotella sp.]